MRRFALSFLRSRRLFFSPPQQRLCFPHRNSSSTPAVPLTSTLREVVRIDSKSAADISISDCKGQPVSISPLDTFDTIDSPPWLREGLGKLKFPSTTSIQKYTIPALHAGHDLIGLAPTGSGKTVAFAVPALRKIRADKYGQPSVLVLAPTRELVQQTTKVFESLSLGEVRVCEAYGGTPREVQARKLNRGCDVLVACPGRLKDFLDSGEVTLSNLQFLVFDEADRLLDMGFQIQLDEILRYLEPAQQVQRMMWSATWPSSVQNLAKNYLSHDRLLIRAGTAGSGLQVNEHIRQQIIFAHGLTERIEKLVELIQSGKIDENTAKVIMFVERQSDTEDAGRALSRRLGIDSRFVGVIHGGLSQRQRDSVLRDFKESYTRLLVATDVASRGLDIPDVTCVVNLQVPKNIDSYCHRIGRTGRAGRTGDAYTFMSRGDGGIAAELMEYLERCGMEPPRQLRDLAEAHESESRNRRRGGGGYNNRQRSYTRDGSNRNWANRAPQHKGFASSQHNGETQDRGTGW